MDIKELKEVIECFDTQRTLIHYYPDRYVIYLMQKLLGENERMSVSEIRSGAYGKLLNRPLLRGLVSGDGYLYRTALDYYNPSAIEGLVVTLGAWNERHKSWNQTTQPSANLVLQFNLSKQWSQKISYALGQDANQIFGWGHPVSQKRGCTLGWTRLDMDFDSGEVLIEEIQTDLVRGLNRLKMSLELAKAKQRDSIKLRGIEIPCAKAEVALEVMSSLFYEHWSEAMLWASIWFCLEELGMNHIYYHEHETGALLKGLNYSRPPRSLYSQLPKKFCFRKTQYGPSFLVNQKAVRRKLNKAKHDVAWYKLAA